MIDMKEISKSDLSTLILAAVGGLLVALLLSSCAGPGHSSCKGGSVCSPGVGSGCCEQEKECGGMGDH